MTKLVSAEDQIYACPTCKEELPRSEFNESNTLAHGLESCCRSCKKTQKSRSPNVKRRYASGRAGDYFAHFN